MSQRIRQNVTQEQLNTGQTDVLDDSITVAWQHETSQKYSQINYFKLFTILYTFLSATDKFKFSGAGT